MSYVRTIIQVSSVFLWDRGLSADIRRLWAVGSVSIAFSQECNWNTATVFTNTGEIGNVYADDNGRGASLVALFFGDWRFLKRKLVIFVPEMIGWIRLVIKF